MEEELKIICDQLRKDIKEQGQIAHSLLSHSDFGNEQTYSGQHAETKANIMLVYRHLEDARMRVGKILQAADDGISILDK